MKPEESARALVAGSDWLALSTIDEAGAAAASYVPFVCFESSFAIAVSGLAAHTAHLRTRTGASVLVIDASYAGDAFARPRLSAAVIARSAVPGSAASQQIWEALQGRHGQTVRTLRALPDFVTMLLEPVRARIVIGFALAIDIDGATLRSVLCPASD